MARPRSPAVPVVDEERLRSDAMSDWLTQDEVELVTTLVHLGPSEAVHRQLDELAWGPGTWRRLLLFDDYVYPGEPDGPEAVQWALRVVAEARCRMACRQWAEAAGVNPQEAALRLGVGWC